MKQNFDINITFNNIEESYLQYKKLNVTTSRLQFLQNVLNYNESEAKQILKEYEKYLKNKQVSARVVNWD